MFGGPKPEIQKNISMEAFEIFELGVSLSPRRAGARERTAVAEALTVDHPASVACQAPERTCSAISASINRRISSIA